MRTTGDKLSTEMNVRFTDANSHEMDRLCNIKMCQFFEGQTVMSLINENSQDLAKLEGIYRRLGELASQVSRFMMTQCHLLAELKCCRSDFSWQVMTSLAYLRNTVKRLYPSQDHPRRQLVDKCLDEFESIKSRLDNLGEIVLHGDFSFRNILAKRFDDQRFCVIDFQDAQVGPAAVDLAIMIVYAVLDIEQVDLAEGLASIPRWIYDSYSRASAFYMNSEELDSYADYLAPLMKARLCMSLMNGQLAFERDPSNSYLMHTNQRGWQLLELLDARGPGRELFL